MRLPRKQLIVALAFSCALTGCGKPKSFDSVQVEPGSSMPQVVNVIAAANGTLQKRNREQVAFLVAVGNQMKEQPGPSIPEPSSTVARPTVATVVPTATSSNCGGDLPPCYVMQRESGGDYSAVNPTGCGGNGCYGRWQFSGAWAGKLGLPSDLSTATPEQQDEAARQLWNGGAGCSNWGAC